jgi:hypothetical protein
MQADIVLEELRVLHLDPQAAGNWTPHWGMHIYIYIYIYIYIHPTPKDYPLSDILPSTRPYLLIMSLPMPKHSNT